LKKKLDSNISERLGRLKEFCEINEGACAVTNRWPEFEKSFAFEDEPDEITRQKDLFLEIIDSGIRKSGKDYLTAINNLNNEESAIGTSWLQGVVDAKTSEATKIMVSGS
jgi:hypothetical protein